MIFFLSHFILVLKDSSITRNNIGNCDILLAYVTLSLMRNSLFCIGVDIDKLIRLPDYFSESLLFRINILLKLTILSPIN